MLQDFLFGRDFPDFVPKVSGMRTRIFSTGIQDVVALLITCGLMLAGDLRAELKLHSLFTDHAVLQSGMAVPVWGHANPDDSVEVSFAAQKVTTKAGADGRWMISLKSLAASVEPRVMTVKAGEQSVTVKDVLVGEVWVCSGQSNMAMSVSGSLGKEKTVEESKKGDYGTIRLFKAPVRGEDERQSEVDALWAICDKKSVVRFSATGFYFGRALNRDLKVPVGLIQSASGGTNAYSWINSGTYQKNPAAQISREFFDQAVKIYPQAKQRYDEQLKAWREKVKEAKGTGTPAKGRAPRAPMGLKHVKRPTGHYNAMIAPLQPYAIKGAIWYQGEANSRPPFAPNYEALMLAMVEGWRQDWAAQLPGKAEKRDFPFYLVQLPNFAGGHAQGWPLIREQMLQFWKNGKDTGMVVAIDVGEAKDIHPRDKTPVGERLARFARGNAYGEDLVYSGPVYQSMAVKGSSIEVKFAHAGEGLKSSDGQALRHFSVAGADGVFVEAEAKITAKDTLTIGSDKVKEPQAVRYAWTSNPEKVNFFNAEELPASPFRTDKWDAMEAE